MKNTVVTIVISVALSLSGFLLVQSFTGDKKNSGYGKKKSCDSGYEKKKSCCAGKEKKKSCCAGKENNKNKVVKRGHVPGAWTMDYNAALEYAKENKKLVLLAFEGSDWCGTCKKMRANTFAQREWKEFANNNLASVFIDFPQKENKVNVSAEQESLNNSLKEKYEVKGIPTYILLDSNGNLLVRLKHQKEAGPMALIDEIKTKL